LAPRATSPALASVDGRPLYLQLVDWLRAEAARLKPGDRIESEPQLARRFGVSRFTVARAVEILVDEGLFTRRQGLGTFVAAPHLKRAPNYLASFTEAMRAQGRATSHRLLWFGSLEPSAGVSYPYPEGARLLRLSRLRFVDGAPTAIHLSVLDAALAEKIGLTEEIAADPQFSLYRVLRESGVVIDRGAEVLQARRASAEEARLLDLDGDRVVMTVRRETYAEDGLLLDVDDAAYDARRFAFENDLRRAPPAPLVTKLTEKTYASNSNDERSFGPRIGPRGDGGGRG
jgi:GntR family transcriptional regulator